MPHAIAPPTVSAPKSPKSRRKTVLVVEPDSAVRERIIRIIKEAAASERDQVSIHEAESGSAAWALVEVVKPDLVVAEILLEGLSGLQLLRRLLGRYPDDPPKMFFVTQMSNEVDRYWALRTGASAFVVKPFDDELLQTRAVKFFEAGEGRLELDSNWPVEG